MKEEININIEELLKELDEALHSCPGAGKQQIPTDDNDL